MKKRSYFKLIVMCLLFAINVSAQEIEWQKTIGGSFGDACYGIYPTTDSGYISCGYSTSNISGDKTEDSFGGGDCWIVKFSSIGVIEWDRTLGGSDVENAFDIQQTSDGNFICGGYSRSGISGNKTDSCRGETDYWIVKLDAFGNILWQKTIGGSGVDWLYSIRETNDQGFICGGYSNSNISGDKTENSMGIEDFWIIKLDSTGSIEWQNTIGGSSVDKLWCIQQTSDNGFICGGSSNSGVSGDKTDSSNGNGDIWIVKLDSLGNIIWQQGIGGSVGEVCTSIMETSDGGFIVGANSSSGISGDKTEPSRSFGLPDCWFLKLDSIGNIIWQKTIGGDKSDHSYFIRESKLGGYIAGGNSNSSLSFDKTEDINGNYDFWILKLDESGKLIWQNNIGGNDVDNAFDVAESLDGSLVIVGNSFSLISGDKTENAKGGGDFWIVKLSNSFNIILGDAFIDFNGDNNLNANEYGLPKRRVSEVNTGRITFTNSEGKYSLFVNDSGQYQVHPSSFVPYFSFIPTFQTASFNGIFQIDSLNDFAFQSAGSFDDLCMTITPIGQFRPGFIGSYMLNYENVGTTTQSSTIVFRIFPNTSFFSSSLTPSFIYPDSVVWNLPPLSPFQTGQILVTVNLSPSIPIGTILNSYAQIFPIVNDMNPSCNNATWEVTVTGSFDPNDISVDQDTLYSNVFPNPPFLDYLIRFQNTGTDTAFTVKILNPLDTFKLDLNSLEFVATSHPMDMRFIYHERNMEFLFNNILLPDSNMNEPASHGFVRYRIKPKSNLQSGDTIKNFAAIYFDFNEPVITNTAMTKIVTPTGINFVEKNTGIKLYPNPATNELFIEFVGASGKSISIDLLNLYGQKTRALYHDRIGNTVWNGKFDLTDLNAGVYLLQYYLDGVTKSVKFVKM